MLTIRLARTGRTNRAFYRVVLTEHTKPVKSGYKTILGWFDPLQHTIEIDEAQTKERIAKGAKPSERVAKLLYNKFKDTLYQKFFVIGKSQKTTKNPDKFTK